MRICVSVTGASGITIAQRLLENLRKHETHVIVSRGAEEVAKYEEGADTKKIKKLASRSYGEKDLAAPLASSSFKMDAMVVVPCSLKTLSAIANGYANNLITRAAENCSR